MSKINEALRQAEKLGQVDRALQSGHLKNILNILDEPKQDISSQEPAKTRPSVVGPQEAVKQMEELSHHVEKSLDDLKGQVDADAAAEHISREAKDVFERGLALARQGMYREAIDWWKRLTLLSGLGEPLSASIRNFERIFNEMEHAQRLLGQRQARPDAVPTILEGAEDLVETICRRLEAETEALKDRRIDAQAQSAERAQNIESGLQKARFFIEHKQTASAIEQLVKTAASLDPLSPLRRQIEVLRRRHADLLELMGQAEAARRPARSDEDASPAESRFVEDFSARAAEEVLALRAALESHRKMFGRPKLSVLTGVLALMIAGFAFILGLRFGAVSAKTHAAGQSKTDQSQFESSPQRIRELTQEREDLLTKIDELKRQSRSQISSLEKRLRANATAVVKPSKDPEALRKTLEETDFALRKATRMLEIVKSDNKAKDRLISQLTGDSPPKSGS